MENKNNKMKKDLKEIAEKVEKFINYEISKIESNENKWKNQYNNVMEELEHELSQINSVVEQFTDSK